MMAVLAACPVFGIESEADDSQREYEREIKAVVRHKEFYKAGKIEFGGTAGIMPYDNVVDHLVLGGRLHWHFSDHYGWEILDLQLGFPTVTSFTTGLVSNDGISNLQATKLKMMASSSFLVSPIYGKVRFWGSSVIHMDMYLSMGLGLANNETFQVSATGKGQAANETILSTKWDPMFTFGLGFKFFLNRAMGRLVDFLDYIVNSEVYANRAFRSNFAVFAGLTFFLPTF